jgi:hypothetical protein
MGHKKKKDESDSEDGSDSGSEASGDESKFLPGEVANWHCIMSCVHACHVAMVLSCVLVSAVHAPWLILCIKHQYAVKRSIAWPQA